jgi:uncharacterized membrane protein YgcG
MSQITNLNISPYFDDFDADNNYYKVLFKPGYPLQARELTTVQSILQKQIEQFGNHFFKDGSVVIPGVVNYNNEIVAVRLQNFFNGIDIFSYVPSIVGNTIRGKDSGVRAYVIGAIDSVGSVKDSVTLYLRFLDSDYQSSIYNGFINGEELVVEATISDLNFFDNTENFILQENDSFANVEVSDYASGASLASISEGVFYIRGNFVPAYDDAIILDQYSNKPNCKVGFRILEEIITANDDENLYDNAQGFSNYSAPGADRLSITLSLDKIDLDEDPGSDFIVLMEIRDGELISVVRSPQYNILLDEIARRTYETNGNYYVSPPTIRVRETLNNLKGNDGIFSKEVLTYGGKIASENLGSYQISPLKAFIRGYEVGTISPTFIDFDKPRTTQTLSDQEIIYNTGSTFTLNRVSGSPRLGISTSYSLSLRDSRVDKNASTSNPGKEIGISRVYDFALESGSYDSSNLNVNEWDISLYDTQLYTEIVLNENLNSNILYNIPCQIKGKSSGAKGYLRYDGRNSGIITAYNTKGSFIVGEKLIFNGIEDSRVSIAITQYSLDDIKSMFGRVGSALTFSADTKQYNSTSIGLVNITAGSNGISTVTSTDYIFTGNLKIGSLVSYTNSGVSTVTYSKVTSISQNKLTITGVSTVSGICEGQLPNSTINPSDFKILKSSLQNSSSNTLYTKLPKKNVSSVDLTSSNLIIRKEFDINISSNSTGTISADIGETFLPFDEERYVLTTSGGTNENLSSDKFSFSSGNSTLTINGLSTTSDTGCKLIATLRKSKITPKVKIKNRVSSLLVDKSKYQASGVGTTSLNDGLTYDNYPYGTRVQDEDICLLKPEVTDVLGIFESKSSSNPILPNVTLALLSGPTNTTDDLILGEEIVGDQSLAVAVYVSKVNSSKIELVYRTSGIFTVGETITFKESGVSATVSSVGINDTDITNKFILEKGQNNAILDYSRIVRKQNFTEPSRKLKIIFEYASYSDSDNGDITVSDSYNQFDYCNLDNINEVSVSDIIDCRPRVSAFSVTTGGYSPFEFFGRSFKQSQSSSKNILASDESFKVNYSFYLPRIDKIFLSKDGKFQLVKGTPSEFPQSPKIIEDSLEIATIYLPSYLCNVSDAEIKLTDHRRYTMADIRTLENRIQNLEYYTSLGLLESSTSNLQIKDSNGLDRTKLGIFVDDFTQSSLQKKDTIFKNSFDRKNSELRPRHYTTFIDLLLGYSSIISSESGLDQTVDLQFSTTLNGSGIRKTNKVLSLDYTEVLEIDQPYSTRVVSVAPFRGTFFGGSIDLFPSSDIWVDTIRLDANLINVEGNTIRNTTPIIVSSQEFDSQIGFSPVEWGSWETQWSGETAITYDFDFEFFGSYAVQNDLKITKRNGISTRKASREISKISYENKSIGDKIISTAVIPYMRSRNIEFTSKRLKPFTRVYSFFDGIDMSTFTFPKLIEIKVTSGVFQVGETVKGIMESDSSNTLISFRVAQSNHKYGPYNAPVEFYLLNPYARDEFIPPAYSSTSTILNVDTYSLANKPQGEYSGVIKKGMILRGQTSGAQASVIDVRLITDEIGSLMGNIHIPNPNIPQNPSFTVGTKLFRLTNSSVNSQIEGSTSTTAEKTFASEGITNTVQENILVLKNVTYDTQVKVETKSVSDQNTEVINVSVIGFDSPPSESPPTQQQTSTQTQQQTSTTTQQQTSTIVTVTPTPTQVPLVSINRGGPVYADAAQSRLVKAYNEVFGTNIKSGDIERVARKLDVDVKLTDRGNLTQKTGNQIVREIKGAAKDQGLSINVAARSGTPEPRSAISAAPKGTQVIASSPSNKSSGGSGGNKGGGSGGNKGGGSGGNKGGGGGKKGGGKGKKSDMNLKTNIQLINNALNRLFNL